MSTVLRSSSLLAAAERAERPAPGRSRNDALAVASLVVLTLLLWLPRIQGPIDLRYDAGTYYVLGTSLAQGTGYRMLNEPGAIEAVQYPPLLPLFVAAHQWALGTSDPAIVAPWLRVSFFFLTLGCALASFFLARRFLPTGMALLAAALALMHPDVLWSSELLFSELPFTLLVLLFLLVMGRPGSPATRGRDAVAGVLAAAAFLLRTAGVALLAAWVGEALLRRRWRRAAVRAGVALLPVLGWQAYIADVTGSPEYADPAYAYQRAPYQFYNVTYAENMQYVDHFTPELGPVSREVLLARVARNVGLSVSPLGQAVSVKAISLELFIDRLNQGRQGAKLPRWPAHVPFVMLGVAVLAGLALLWLRGERLIPLFTAGSVVLIATTPWPGQFIRYLVPLVPLLTLALCVALAWAWDRLRTMERGRWRLGGRLLVVALAAGALALQLRLLHWLYFEKWAVVTYQDAAGREHRDRFFYFDHEWQEHVRALDWLADVAGPDETIVTWTSHYAYLLTGRRAVMPPFEADAAEAQRLVETVPASYLVIDDNLASHVSHRYALPMVQSNPERWQLIYATPDSISLIYRYVGGESGRQPSDGSGDGRDAPAADPERLPGGRAAQVQRAP